jgi:hypothetical protein
MKITLSFLLCCLILVSCTQKPESVKQQLPLNGTWKLLSGTLIENGDTTVTEYTAGVSFIKIINDDHFAFLQHDLNHGADSSAVFVAGGGPYTLKDSLYTEHLEYCNDRGWEGHDFSFVVSVKNDTLIQKGMEVIPEKGVNRLNIEVYVKQ